MRPSWLRGRVAGRCGRANGRSSARAAQSAHLVGVVPDMRRTAAPQPFLIAALGCMALLPAASEALAQQGAGDRGDRAAKGSRPATASRWARARASQSRREVRRLQRRLSIPADGVFGRQTQRAVRRFQRRRGITVDGIVGPVTREALGLGAGPVLKRERLGSRRAGRRLSRRSGEVRALQRALGIPADGVFGPQTESAVRRFQRRHGLVADGVVGPITRSALGLGPGRTLRRRGGAGALRRLVRAANRIADRPFRLGGGHRTFQDSAYDCSGSISYVLHRAGLLTYALTSGGFMSYGKPGSGRHVTIYAHRKHAFMLVDGRRYDTTAIRETGSRWTWTPRSTRGFVARHPPGL